MCDLQVGGGYRQPLEFHIFLKIDRWHPVDYWLDPSKIQTLLKTIMRHKRIGFWQLDYTNKMFRLFIFGGYSYYTRIKDILLFKLWVSPSEWLTLCDHQNDPNYQSYDHNHFSLVYNYYFNTNRLNTVYSMPPALLTSTISAGTPDLSQTPTNPLSLDGTQRHHHRNARL